MAKSVEDIEMAISQLPNEQLKAFRTWYEKFDSDAWDKQIKEDADTGKLDSLASSALKEHHAGKSKRL